MIIMIIIILIIIMMIIMIIIIIIIMIIIIMMIIMIILMIIMSKGGEPVTVGISVESDRINVPALLSQLGALSVDYFSLSYLISLSLFPPILLSYLPIHLPHFPLSSDPFTPQPLPSYLLS